MKLITVTKKEPVGVEMSVKEFLQVLVDNTATLEFTVGNTRVAFTLEQYGLDHIEEKGGRIFITTEDSSGTFENLEGN